MVRGELVNCLADDSITLTDNLGLVITRQGCRYRLTASLFLFRSCYRSGVNGAYKASPNPLSIAHRRPNRRMTADTQVVTSRNGMRLNLLKANISGRMAHIRRSCPASTPRLKPIRQKARCDFGMAISASAFANPKPCISPKQKVSPHR